MNLLVRLFLFLFQMNIKIKATHIKLIPTLVLYVFLSVLYLINFKLYIYRGNPEMVHWYILVPKYSVLVVKSETVSGTEFKNLGQP